MHIGENVEKPVEKEKPNQVTFDPNIHDQKKPILTHISPRMVRFEESDRMMFDENSSKEKKSENHTSKKRNHDDKYEAYSVFNFHAPTPDSFTEPRIVKLETELPSIEEESSRNSSRFFRFEEPVKNDRSKLERNSPIVQNFFQNVRSDPPKNTFRFPSENHPSRADSEGSFSFQNTRTQSSQSNPLKFNENYASTTPKYSHDASPPIVQSNDDQFYTVKASIQIDTRDTPTITPPNLAAPIATRRPKKKKAKIYNQPGVDIRKQDGFLFPRPADYESNHINSAQQQQDQYPANYAVNNPYYQAPTAPDLSNPTNYQGGPQNPYTNPYYPNPTGQSDLDNYYYQNYLGNYPYSQQNPYYQSTRPNNPQYPTNPYFQQPNIQSNLIPGSSQQSDSPNPLSAQSILGFLQNIFNFAPGTFGSFPAANPGTGNPGRPQHYQQQPQYSPSSVTQGSGNPAGGVGGGFTAVSSQLRRALDNIAENDDLQCVPKLICMMSRRSTGQGFSAYVNRGLLSTVLTAVPDGSPWLKFSRAALLGYGIGANSCDVYYPKCPKDESEIIYYLNNHRGGFFRFFNNGQQQQQPNGLTSG
ncbi:uncharacterized protein LOC129756126 [Uranotaenia lowii]|uniref:uncharacterized protein LOC129756126 n=1 Tax=Uranotaenia lowii TaxID=190385 RepID=UPI0024787530|nr:uncharacterized protein LOC129756126 [Uranotaenia lowii]